jgi:hypothetical protein
MAREGFPRITAHVVSDQQRGACLDQLGAFFSQSSRESHRMLFPFFAA